MTEQFEEIRQMLVSMLTDSLSAVIEFTPKLVAAAFVLLIGWLLARLVRTIAEHSIRAGCWSVPAWPRPWSAAP
jgi:hypothetical protein